MRVKFFADMCDLRKRFLEGELRDYLSDIEYIIIIDRGDDFFNNKTRLLYSWGQDITVVTNDETILNCVPYDEEFREFKIDIKFEDSDKFIPLREIYFNMRKENDMIKLYHSGVFHQAWYEYKDKQKQISK